MIETRTKTVKDRLLKGFLACLLLTCLSLPVGIGSAYADVRKADSIMGQTVDSRGLSVAQCPSIDAEYAIVMSSDGTIYYERNATAPTQIASITKVMTAIIAMESASNETAIVVSSNAASVGESSASLQEGDILTLDAALKALLLSSGNDASVAIAESIGELLSGGTAKGSAAEQVFIDRMNAKAAEMGLQDTVFRNPHGLDDDGYEGDQHSCALDVAKMSKLAMENEIFRSIVATPETTIQVTHADGSRGTLALQSTDQMLGNFEGACGIKTGFTDLAGQCFAGAANRGGQDFYAVVLHSTDQDQRFFDAQTLLQWVYDHNVAYPLVHSDHYTDMVSGGQTSSVPVVAEVAHGDWIDKTFKATLTDPSQAVAIFDLNGNISQTVEYNTIQGDIHVGDKVGTITFKQRNNELITVDMVACEEVKAPDLFEGIGIWWDRLFRGFSGQKTVADNVLVNQTPLVNDRSGTV